MNFQKIIISPKFLVIIFYILLHLFLLNINTAEWGDSYRILRASEIFKSTFSYPIDEKRPPLYSILLSLRPSIIDPVIWGRIFMYGVSLVILYFYLKFLDFFNKNNFFKLISVLFLLLNPVFLYWSLRIYADVFFAFLVLLAFYIFYIYKNNFKNIHLILLSLVCGLSILTRFEGYILTISISFGLLTLNLNKYIKKITVQNIFNLFALNFKVFLSFVFILLITLIPYYLYKNPFESSYFNEPSSRKYDLNTIFIFFTSLLYIFGFTGAFSFLIFDYKNIIIFLKNNLALSLYIFLQLLLALLWPAAIPRLFVPSIPFLIILLSQSIYNIFKNIESIKNIYVILFQFIFLSYYVLSQYFLRLQFLIPNKFLFVFLVILQVLVVTLFFLKKHSLLLFFIFASCFVWSISIIYIHKDNFISVKKAGLYAMQNLNGTIAYNDVSSVSDWYLNQHPFKNSNIFGFYYNFEKDSLLTFDSLIKKELDYLIITNEHNKNLSIDLSKRPYLILIKDFSYKLNGTIFNTSVVKLNKLHNTNYNE